MLFRFDGVTKAYGAHDVLRDVSFQVNPGEHVGLVGRNGAGKTTTFKLLLDREDPDEGRIEKMRGLRIGLLEQQVTAEGSGTVRHSALEVFADLHAMEREMRGSEKVARCRFQSRRNEWGDRRRSLGARGER